MTRDLSRQFYWLPSGISQVNVKNIRVRPGRNCFFEEAFVGAPNKHHRRWKIDMKRGVSIIVMSVVGGAVIPPALGYLAREHASYALGYVVTGACYVVVAAYALVAVRRTNVAVSIN